MCFHVQIKVRLIHSNLFHRYFKYYIIVFMKYSENLVIFFTIFVFTKHKPAIASRLPRTFGGNLPILSLLVG